MVSKGRRVPPAVPTRRLRPGRERGFSVLELLVVASILLIMMAISLFTLAPHRRVYVADEAAHQVASFMREANQRALAQRQTMRVRIDRGTSTIQLIDEGTLAGGDEAVVREEGLIPDNQVSMDVPTDAPPLDSPFNYTPASFGSDVWETRFRSDGAVVNPAGTVSSAALYFWPRPSADGSEATGPQATRALTIFGPSGSIRFWRFDGTAWVAGAN